MVVTWQGLHKLMECHKAFHKPSGPEDPRLCFVRISAMASWRGKVEVTKSQTQGSWSRKNLHRSIDQPIGKSKDQTNPLESVFWWSEDVCKCPKKLLRFFLNYQRDSWTIKSIIKFKTKLRSRKQVLRENLTRWDPWNTVDAEHRGRLQTPSMWGKENTQNHLIGSLYFRRLQKLFRKLFQKLESGMIAGLNLTVPNCSTEPIPGENYPTWVTLFFWA